MQASFWPYILSGENTKVLFPAHITAWRRFRGSSWQLSKQWLRNPSSSPPLWGCHVWCPRQHVMGRECGRLSWGFKARLGKGLYSYFPSSLTRTQSHGPNLFEGWEVCTGKRTKMIIVVSQALSQVQQPRAPRGGQGKLPVEVKCICKLCLISHKRVPWSFPRDAASVSRLVTTLALSSVSI